MHLLVILVIPDTFVYKFNGIIGILLNSMRNDEVAITYAVYYTVINYY